MESLGTVVNSQLAQCLSGTAVYCKCGNQTSKGLVLQRWRPENRGVTQHVCILSSCTWGDLSHAGTPSCFPKAVYGPGCPGIQLRILIVSLRTRVCLVQILPLVMVSTPLCIDLRFLRIQRNA